MQVNLTRNYSEYIGSNFYVEKQYGKKNQLQDLSVKIGHSVKSVLSRHGASSDSTTKFV